MTAMTSRMPKFFRRLVRDRRGVSAVEFALIAPMMIGLYLGCVEISDGVSVDRKVSLITSTIANLTASCSTSNANGGGCPNNTISADEMNNILDASSAIIAPYASGKLKMTVSCLSIDKNQAVTVKWKTDRNGGVGGTVTVPSELTADYTPDKTKTYPVYLIYSQVSYDYTPIIGYTITGTISLSDKMYMEPRTDPPIYVAAKCSA